MSYRPSHRAVRGATPQRRFTAGMLAVGMTAAIAAVTLPAQATTTLSPTEAGSPPVVRDSSLTLNTDRSALTYSRLFSTQTFSAQSQASAAILGAACAGDLPTGTNNSARTTVTVSDPSGAPVLTTVSPVRQLGLASLTTSPKSKALVPQPAPAAGNYRGDFPVSANDNTFHGFTSTVDLTGKPAGIYTVTTVDQHMVKTGSTCSIGRPGPDNRAVIAGPEVSTQTFEYRPWKATFKDVLGAGQVQANLTPAEFTFSIGSKTSPIYADAAMGAQTFYALPSTTGYALPSDLTACGTDPGACVPATAVKCEPSSGCVPRIMIVNKPTSAGDPKGIIGAFDLTTKAFVASVTIDGTTRMLLSLGTDNDAAYGSTLASLSAGAAAQGIDLASILTTKVKVGNGANQVSLSLLNGLQIDPSTAKGGVQIVSDSTAQAGVILDIHSSLRLAGGPCVANSGSSTTGDGRYTRKEDNGYTVTRSDLLPSVPKAGALGAIAGGPIFHITGKFTSGTSSTVANTATAAIGVDTAAGEPNGYPVWVQPFLSGSVHTAAPRTMDFIGTATWSASESPVLQGCLAVNFMLGTGVAVYNNPLPVGLGTIFDPLARAVAGCPAADRHGERCRRRRHRSGDGRSDGQLAARPDHGAAAAGLIAAGTASGPGGTHVLPGPGASSARQVMSARADRRGGRRPAS